MVMFEVAPAISTEAVYKTADMFETESPKAANLLKRSSYVDDLIESQPSTLEAVKIAHETEDMLAKGGVCGQVLAVYWRVKSLQGQNVVRQQ